MLEYLKSWCLYHVWEKHNCLNSRFNYWLLEKSLSESLLNLLTEEKLRKKMDFLREFWSTEVPALRDENSRNIPGTL